MSRPQKTAPKPSELRQDPITGDWIAIATGRAKRPHAFAVLSPAPQDAVETCPFEDLRASGNTPLAYVGPARAWRIAVIPNKYPAFASGAGPQPKLRARGPYRVMDGTGFHEVFVLRDHTTHPARLSKKDIHALLWAYVQRVRVLGRARAIAYVSVFHNHGRAAGASLTHPHSQLIALPIMPPDLRRSLEASERVFRETGSCAHCTVLAHERKAGSRIVAENAHATAFAPFASRAAFELRIYPRRHRPHLADLTPAEAAGVADVLHRALRALDRGLGNPAYNYFIHTAPVNGKAYPHYHWHLEIVPKLQTWAGFEISTGIEISTITPEAAARFLRSYARA